MEGRSADATATFEAHLRQLTADIDSMRGRVETIQHGVGREEAPEPLWQQMIEELQTSLEELSAAQEELHEQQDHILDAHRQAQLERERYQSLFENAPDGYLVTDINGMIREANRAACRLLAMDRRGLIGKPLTVYIGDEWKREFRALLTSLQQTPLDAEHEVALTPRGSEEVHVALTVTAMHNDAGEVEGLRWLLRDITERKRAAAALQHERDMLEQRVAERTRDLTESNRRLQDEIVVRRRVEEQLATNQHEIDLLNQQLQRAMVETHHRVKNNLQVIAAMVDMRLMDDLPTIPRDDWQRLGMHIRALASIHDLLTQQAKEDKIARRISGTQVVRRLIKSMSGIDPTRGPFFIGTEIELTAHQATSLAILANELVHNAAKHGKGRIEVEINCDANAATLRVRDRGAGFPPDFSPREAAHTGLDLVENLTRHDLRGRTVYANLPDGGAEVSIVFPL